MRFLLSVLVLLPAAALSCDYSELTGSPSGSIDGYDSSVAPVNTVCNWHLKADSGVFVFLLHSWYDMACEMNRNGVTLEEYRDGVLVETVREGAGRGGEGRGRGKGGCFFFKEKQHDFSWVKENGKAKKVGHMDQDFMADFAAKSGNPALSIPLSLSLSLS